MRLVSCLFFFQPELLNCVVTIILPDKRWDCLTSRGSSGLHPCMVVIAHIFPPPARGCAVDPRRGDDRSFRLSLMYAHGGSLSQHRGKVCWGERRFMSYTAL